MCLLTVNRHAARRESHVIVYGSVVDGREQRARGAEAAVLRAERGEPHAHDVGERRRVFQARDRDEMDLVVCANQHASHTSMR